MIDKISSMFKADTPVQPVTKPSPANKNNPFKVVDDPDKSGAEEVKVGEETKKKSGWTFSRDSVLKLGTRIEDALGNLGSGLDKKVDQLTSRESMLKISESFNNLANYVTPRPLNSSREQGVKFRNLDEEKDDFVEFEDPNPAIDDV